MNCAVPALRLPVPKGASCQMFGANSQQEIQQIAAAAFPPKVKYWVMRMVAAANSAGEAFATARNKIIMDMGEQVFLYIPPKEEAEEAIEYYGKTL